MSARHFLDIDGAATLPTQELGLVDQAVADLVRTQAMGAVHGPAGLGKTFAVEQALDRRAGEVAACWVSFPSRPTMRLVAATLVHELTGVAPARRDRFVLTAELLEELADHRGRDRGNGYWWWTRRSSSTGSASSSCATCTITG